MIKVSIILPVYNVEPFIERCIESVMAQNCSNIDIECIIVDDCGQDSSMEIVRQRISAYSGPISFIVLKHDKNQGLSVARNTGMNHATGDFLFFMDSDDYITDNCLEKLISPILNNSAIDVVKGNHIGRVEFVVSRIPTIPLDNDTLLNLFYRSVIQVMAWNTLIRRSLIVKYQLSFRPGILFEDNLWSAQLYRHVENFLFVHDKTYYYEDGNHNSITGNKVLYNKQKEVLSFIVTVEELLKCFDTNHFVTYTFFVVSFFMKMMDMILKDGQMEKDTKRKIYQLRNQLMKYTLCHFRIFLALLELWLFSPFRQLMRFRWFRTHYDFFSRTIYALAMSFNKLH